MVSRVRTINFLPEIFKTKANEQFLSATLDQLVSQPNMMKIQGYVGSKFGYGINATDGYVVEPSKVRTDYQLEPSVVFLKKNTSTAVDLLTYPGLVDALTLEGGITNQHDDLFSNQFYSWDSFTNLDKLINYNQYYWLPLGPELVTVSTNDVYNNTDFTVIPNGNYINFNADNLTIPGNNPTISLLRGGTYHFTVDQTSNFWIQGSPGLKGTDPVHTNVGTRNIYGLTNNGISKGVMTFEVPFQSDQSYAFYPSTQSVDLLTTKSWDEINGMRVRDLGNIDGVVSLDGRTIVFYGNSPTAQGFIGEFYDESSFDEDDPVVKLYEDGFYTDLNKHIYRISYMGNPDDPIIRVTEHANIVQLDRIKVLYGDEFAYSEVYTDPAANMYMVPYLSALADTLYYQDGSNASRVGIIKIIDAISNNQLNVNTQVIGKKTFTSPNGVEFTNGLKVTFAGNIYPESYITNEFYVEGVGTSITLLPVLDFIVPEPAGQAYYNPYSISPYDTLSYDSASNVPLEKDYITISRNSYDWNAWSRSNRWFHVDVLRATAKYRGNKAPIVSEALNNSTYRAKRPIIEFYPNLKLYNQGSVGKGAVDFIDNVVTDPFGYNGSTPVCAGATSFYPNNGTSEIPSGVKIIFTAAEDINVRNKIYYISYSSITGTSTPVITLSVAADGDVGSNDQVVITSGEYIGQTYRFDGTNWNNAQFKERVNQAPLFDVFSNNNISFGDQDYYLGSSFRGCTLFEYALGTGTDDPVLGFPLKYSSLTNIGDITFSVTLNTQSFTYVEGTAPKSLSVDTGYVFQYSTGTNEYNRQLGWQTTVGESFQYQVFELTYKSGTPEFTCDIPYKDPDSTQWPVTQVYVNNERLALTSYTRSIDSHNNTIITLNDTPLAGTPIEVLIYSDSPSSTGYYEIPSNLQNNPFNTPVSTANLGDIRGHYKSICNNITTLVGAPFGANNYRDLGNLIPYGTRIIQSSASLVPAAAFLRNQDFSIFNSLNFNCNEYIKFKALLTDTINRTEYDRTYTDAYILDDALSQIAGTKDNSSAFFWSDMVPTGNKFASNTYTFVNFIKQSEFPLTKIYDFATANYFGVLIYVTRTTNGETHTTQLLRSIDYDVSADAPKVIVYFDLLPGDAITIDEYSQTYGNFVPNTPTKLGLYPASTPQVIYDTTYVTPTYFIKGHDGSLTKLYGEYTDGYLSDYRDRAYLEFEKRIFNNIKTSNVIPLTLADIIPGQFRTTDYTYEQVQQVYSYGFLNWIGKNRIDYKTQYFNITNEYTYNYNQSVNKLDYTQLKQGNWRGIYLWFYDTATPQSTPWEMLGFTEKPTWWESHYGVAPYTSDNELLWNDLANGYVWNNGLSYVIENRKRPGLLSVLPVDSNGDLVSPVTSVVNNYDENTIHTNWKVGDVGPAEYGYLKSSSWPFDLMRMFALMKPAKFFSLCIDVDHYEYNAEFNQYLENARQRSPLNNLPVYGNGTAVNSYINWIVDYIQQLGMSGYDKVTDLVNNLDVRLAYRVAGFSDKDMLKFYVEKGSPNSKNNSLLIPDESYGVLLYNNQPFTKVVYSSVIIQKSLKGYKVYGNSQNTAFFRTLIPKMNGNYDKYTVADVTVYVSKDYTGNTQIVPYGTEFYSIQALCEFLINYGHYLENDGMIFDNVENGVVENWEQMVAETIYWTQSGWEVGSTVNVNPAATNLKINKESGIVQPLTFHQQNYVLNQNLVPIQVKDMSLIRNGTEFTLNVLQNNDTFSYMTANISNYEHCVVFDNVTLFNDVIYNLVTGLRQERVLVKGVKSAEWDGQVDAQGFILNQDNIQEWQENAKYTKGVIVLYKNSYYTSTKIIQPSATFNETEWVKTEYDTIQKGLLPNPSTRSYESLLYYDTHNTNLENDADLLSFSLIGYRPRDYLAVANLDDVTQVNVFMNMIKSMGTLNGADQLKNITVPQGQLGYDIYENWAIKTGEFGGVLNQNFIEFKLDENELTGNPGIVGVTDGIEVVEGVEQSVPLYSLTNYGRVLNNTMVLPTVEDISINKLPDAGYVNFDDVKIYNYGFNGLNRANLPIEKLYNGEYIWLADYKGNWNVYTPISLGTISNKEILLVTVENNLTGTATLIFNNSHGLVKNDLIGVVNFNPDLNGYYIVDKIISDTAISVSITISGSNLRIRGSGIVFKLVTHRVDSPSNASTLPVIGQEFEKAKIWTDQTIDGNWAVYERDDRYTYEAFEKPFFTTNFGSSAVYIPDLGYLIGDPGEGKVFLYTYNPIAKQYINTTELNEGYKFGTAMETADNTVIISKTDSGSSKMFVYKVVTDFNVNQVVKQQEITLPGNCGYSMAISGDTNWIYISDNTNNKVLVYQLDQDYTRTNTTYPVDGTVAVGSKTFKVSGNRASTFESGAKLSFSNSPYSKVYIVITSKWDTDTNKTTVTLGEELLTSITNATATYIATINYTSADYIELSSSTAGDNFGREVTTNFDGSTVVINSPNREYDGLYQTWSPSTTYTAGTVLLNSGTYYEVLANAPGVLSFSLIASYVRELKDIGYVYVFERLTQTYEQQYNQQALVPTLFKTIWSSSTLRPTPYVYLNGVQLRDGSDYSIVTTDLVIEGDTPLNAGDIITVSGSEFVLKQTLAYYDTIADSQNNTEFGYGLDTNKFGTEILGGSPYIINDDGQEGAVFRFTDGGKKYGMIVGTTIASVSSPTQILINGFVVNISGTASQIAIAINNTNINNVVAYDSDGILVIGLRDTTLNPIGNKLSITVLNKTTLDEMGIAPYTKTQRIEEIYTGTRTQFGAAIRCNELNSFVVSAPVTTRRAITRFDYIDDNLNNDTIFDNDFTTFIDGFANAGAVYMYDYLPKYNESIDNTGKYVFAQSCNDVTVDYGYEPNYGQALFFGEYRVLIGTPNFDSTAFNGRLVIYKNDENKADWSVYRSSSPVVDVDRLQGVQLYDNINNSTLTTLDYIDPLQGKLLGAVRENIDVISSNDPAGYNINNVSTNVVWGAGHIGTIWLDVSRMRFVNYHQNDIVYNSKYWGKVFDGSDVAVYSWIESTETPAFYTGSGIPYDLEKYATAVNLDSAGNLIAKYYYWVRDTGQVFTKKGKTLADTILETYITDPQDSGISYFAPYTPKVYGLHNAREYLNNTNTSIHIGFSTGTNDDVAHNEYQLIRSGFAGDFLTGIPSAANSYSEPTSLYNRLLDSMAGLDESGLLVPNPYLPKLLQRGIASRPSQSFFVDRFTALKNYLTYANEVMASFPIVESKSPTFLTKVGPNNPSNDLPFYDTNNVWEYTDWWATGYANNTKTAFDVPKYYNLAELTPSEGLLVGVETNSDGKREVYVYENSSWVRVGLQDGTIQFNSILWDYSSNRLGFGNFFDTTPFDSFPSQETRNVIRALNEEIYTDDLLINRNASLILLLNYIQSENIESQNYLPWLNKTSFIDVAHTIRELREYEKFQRDNVDFLSGYINEVKPYHVVIKDFYLKYTGVNVYQGDITDFDLPSIYNKEYEQFITPTLQYSSTTGDTEYLPSASIWDTPEYSSWYQNFGLTIGGQANTYVGKIKRQLTTVATEILVGNTFGFPVQGIIKIDNEIILYTNVNRELGLLTGVARGYDGTAAAAHDYNSSVYMDVPGAVVFDTARGYIDPPIINAVIDTSIYPAPRVPARFRAIMQVDKVIGIDILDPGEGYVVTPRLVFQSSMSVDFTDADINYQSGSITIQSTKFVTGDCLEYSTSNYNVTGLKENSHYYIRVLSSTLTDSVIALYYSKNDAEINSDRIPLFNPGKTVNAKLSMTPRAELIMSPTGVRSIKPILKFDRTSYRPLVAEWVPGNYYGSGLNLFNSSSGEILAIAQPYEDMPIANRGVTSTALFVVQNVLMGSYFEVTDITESGSGYSVGDTITIPGTDMDPTWASPGNDCTVTVAAVDIAGRITDVTATGTPGLVTRSSLQGALFPILNVIPVGGKATVELDLSVSGLDISKLRNLNLYFYDTVAPYTYDNSSAGGAIIKVYRPKFTSTTVLNEYVITIINAGAIYNAGQKITILGSLLGGANIVNDATITITSVTSLNAIETAVVSGVAVGGFRSYYVTPISSSTVSIFNDINMTIPTPMSNFPYTTGDQGFVNDPALATSSSSYNYTNYVVYKDKIFKCVQDTNSRTFLYDQWAEVDGNLELFNALDRIVGYYQPTSDMPGKNLQGLVKGIAYTNNTYYGNPFAPEDQYPLDINLKSQTFYPAYVDIRSITYDGTQYVAVGENDNNSVILKSSDGTDWSIAIISDQPLDVRDIVYDSSVGAYVVTSYNSTTPVLVSFDANTWSSSGPFTPYDIGGYDYSPFDRTSVNLSNMKMVGDTYGNGLYVSVGDTYIITSDNGLNWDQQFAFNVTGYTLNGVTYANLIAFNGFVAVGGHSSTSSASGTTTYGDIVISNDGINWSYLTPPLVGYKLYGVTANNTYVVAVGESGITYYTANGSNWTSGQILSADDYYDITYANGLFVTVGQNGKIYTSIDGITWTSSTSGVTEDLRGIYHNGTQYIAVGNNSTILFSPDAITWTKVGLLQQNAPFYNIEGSSFDYGYSPEEMVAGVVSDNLSMYVKTRPSGAWDYQTYQHTGFSMISRVAVPDSNNTISFDGLVDIPATISVFVVDSVTLVGNRIYENTTSPNINHTYTVDWINKAVTIDSALTSTESILVEVYEVGGGNQLAKDCTDNVPLRVDSTTGFSEIHLGYKYSSTVYSTPICFLNGIKLTYIEDYYLDTTPQGTTKISFTNTYTQNVDYITYTIFGSTLTTTQPEQYGFSIPETQVIVGDGTTTKWALDNFVYYIPPLGTVTQTAVNDTAVVEINGIRKITPADITYNIFPSITAIISVSATDAFSFVIATYPDIDKVVAGSNIRFGTDPTLYPITASNVDPSNASLWILTTTGAPAVLPGNGVVVSALIEFDIAPAADDVVGVTTFNDVRQQSLVLDTGTNFEVNQIYYINNNSTPVKLVLANPVGSGDWANGTMIRVDGIEGSIQLNNNVYYVKKINSTTYSLYVDPTVLIPVQSKLISKYISGGYAWLDSQVFTVTQPLFTEEDNNRVWVTINGERLSPTSLRYVTNNGLTLLTPIVQSDIIDVTSMIPTATPNELVYNVTVDKNNSPAVYRSNNNTSTWITQDLLITDDTIYVNDASRAIDTLVQTISILNTGTQLIAPIQADYASVREITVYNKNTLSQVSPSSFALAIVNTVPVIEFNSEVSVSDQVIVTIRVGDIVVINSERIRFNTVDYANNTLSGLTRGIQGTGPQNVHSTYSQVFSLIPTNELFNTYYYQVWDDLVFKDITTTVTSTTPGEFKFTIASAPDIVNVTAGSTVKFGTNPVSFTISTSIKDPSDPTLWILRTTGSPSVTPGDAAVISYAYSGNPLQLSNTDPANFLKSGNI